MGHLWYSDDQIREAIKSSPDSMFQAAKKSGIGYQTLIKRAKILGIYAPNQGGKGVKKGKLQRYPRYKTKDILAGKHPNYTGNRLKKRLYNEGYKKEECERCGLVATWNRLPLVLELNHKDGISHNHLLENLEILCPNCHSQTPTHRAKNKGNYKRERGKRPTGPSAEPDRVLRSSSVA